MDLRKFYGKDDLEHLVNKLKHLNRIVDVHLERIGCLNYLTTLVSHGTTSSGNISKPSWRVLWRRSDDPAVPRPSPIHITTAIALAGNWHY